MIMVATKAVLYLFDSKSSGKQQLIFLAYPLHETQQISLMDKILVQFFNMNECILMVRQNG